MQHDTATPEINVCISGKLTHHGQPVPFDAFLNATESEGLDISGGCTEMANYLSVTAIIGRDDGSPFRKEEFKNFLAQHAYTFEGEIWEEPNDDWH